MRVAVAGATETKESWWPDLIKWIRAQREKKVSANAFLEGGREGLVAHEPIDVREVRARTDLKRRELAERYNLNPRRRAVGAEPPPPRARHRKCRCA